MPKRAIDSHSPLGGHDHVGILHVPAASSARMCILLVYFITQSQSYYVVVMNHPSDPAIDLTNRVSGALSALKVWSGRTVRVQPSFLTFASTVYRYEVITAVPTFRVAGAQNRGLFANKMILGPSHSSFRQS